MFLIVSIISGCNTTEYNDYTEETEQGFEIEEEVEIETQSEEILLEDVEPIPNVGGALNYISKDWDAEETYLLAKIAMAEAGCEDTFGKALVICVILNRVNDDYFPNTIEEVIFQNNGKGSYQFSPVRPGGSWYKVEPSEDCYKAVELVQSGWDESKGALYFTSSKKQSTWHSRNLEFLFQHGGHKFYK